MSDVMVLDASALSDIWNHLLEYEEIFYTALRILAIIAMTQFMNWSQDHLLEEQYGIENPAEQTEEEVTADDSANGVIDDSADSVANGSSDGVADGSVLGAAGGAANGAAQPRLPNNYHGRRRNRKNRTFAPDQELYNQEANDFQLHFLRPRTCIRFRGRQRFM